MIINGCCRKGSLDLAVHLSNSVDNETVKVAEVRGAVSDDIFGAFKEWELICTASKATKPFYSLNLNPDPKQRDWTEDEWRYAIDHIEKRLELDNQPRAIVFHEKLGADGKLRKHCHAVWSRAYFDRQKNKFLAVHLGNDHFKLRSCAQELAKTFKLELPNGLKPEHEKKNYDFAKSHGENRDPETGITRQENLTALWNGAQSPEAFIGAVFEAGYVIAEGQRRAFVIVDMEGQVHALARQIANAKTKDIKARLGDPEKYPSVDEAKEQQRQRKHAIYRSFPPPEQRRDIAREQRQMQKLRCMARRADELARSRQKNLTAIKTETQNRHKTEWDALKQRQRANEAYKLRRRHDKKPTGVVKTICDAIGVTNIMKWLDNAEDAKRLKQYRAQRENLSLRHQTEINRLKRKTAELRQLEKRESQSYRRLARKLGVQADMAALANDDKSKRKNAATSLRLA